MITGRDLIIYILRNGLEDEPVFEHGQFIGFYTIEKYAEVHGYGVETVKAKILMGQIKDAISVGSTFLIPKGAENENESN